MKDIYIRTGKVRGVDTRTRILESALELFAQNGYYKTSISQIVEKSASYRAAIEWHFGSKQGILIALLENYLENRFLKDLKNLWIKYLNKLETSPDISKLTEELFKDLTILTFNNLGILNTFFMLIVEHAYKEQKINAKINQSYKQVLETFKWMVESWAKARKLDQLIKDSELLAKIILAQTYGIFIQWHISSNQPKPDRELFRQLVQTGMILFNSYQIYPGNNQK